MQKPFFSVRAVKLLHLKGVGVCSRTQTCVNWVGPIAVVPSLHQGNISIKRKIRVWRDQKCIRVVGAKTPLTCEGRQTTRLKGVGIGPRTESCINWGGPIAMVSCLHQGNIYIKRKLHVWRQEMYSPSWCKKPFYLCGPSNYPVSREAA